MTPPDPAERDAISARLARSRAEISRLLEPPPQATGDQQGSPPSSASGRFPRSRTLQALMSGRGLGAIGALAGGLLIARPVLAWRLLQMLPTGAVTRMVMMRVIGALRRKR